MADVCVQQIAERTVVVQIAALQGPRGAPGSGSGGGIEVPFGFGDASPVLIGVPLLGSILSAAIAITTPFDGPASLSLGTVSQPSLLLSETQNLPQEVGTYRRVVNQPLSVFTQLVLTIGLSAGVTAGRGAVVLEITDLVL